MAFNTTDKAREILTCRNDRDDLASHHLKLLENAVNGRVNDNDETAFKASFVNVLCGSVKPCFRNVDHTAQPLARFTASERVALRVVLHALRQSPTPTERITSSLGSIYREHLRASQSGHHTGIIVKLDGLKALERIALIDGIEAP
jgi:hypothetical protein